MNHSSAIVVVDAHSPIWLALQAAETNYGSTDAELDRALAEVMDAEFLEDVLARFAQGSADRYEVELQADTPIGEVSQARREHLAALDAHARVQDLLAARERALQTASDNFVVAERARFDAMASACA